MTAREPSAAPRAGVPHGRWRLVKEGERLAEDFDAASRALDDFGTACEEAARPVRRPGLHRRAETWQYALLATLLAALLTWESLRILAEVTPAALAALCGALLALTLISSASWAGGGHSLLWAKVQRSGRPSRGERSAAPASSSLASASPASASLASVSRAGRRGSTGVMPADVMFFACSAACAGWTALWLNAEGLSGPVAACGVVLTLVVLAVFFLSRMRFGELIRAEVPSAPTARPLRQVRADRERARRRLRRHRRRWSAIAHECALQAGADDQAVVAGLIGARDEEALVPRADLHGPYAVILWSLIRCHPLRLDSRFAALCERSHAPDGPSRDPNRRTREAQGSDGQWGGGSDEQRGQDDGGRAAEDGGEQQKHPPADVPVLDVHD
ncbi:hypothetical protein [Streptosporangium carneum]|uniref:Uncharacterized protein n=1 Tax=Streptosporangium carneum TaxID=47481 RepID=A0A9W6MER3_9ACTN|nr:hypothetical protein [Streptosporangium carneum]GLK11098.1 hypothetical protein GCM10017600_45040 [Streptosporangium carneum]